MAPSVRLLVPALALVLHWGCAGPGAEGGDLPALALVEPATVFPGRTVALQIAGSGTHFSAATQVSFDDPALRVLDVAAGSPGNLRVRLAVDAAVRFGAHDVTVHTPGGGGDERLGLAGGLGVVPSLVPDPLPPGQAPPAVPQGGVFQLAVRNLDPQDPFFSPMPTGGCLAVGLNPVEDGERYINEVLVDALAAPGGLPVVLTGTSLSGGELPYVMDPAAPDAPQVQARPARPLTPGVALPSERFAERGETALYRLAAPGPEQVALLRFSGLGDGLRIAGVLGYVAPQSGRFGAGRPLTVSQDRDTAAGLALLPEAGESYLALFPADLGGGRGYEYQVAAHLATGRRISLKETAPDTPDHPLADIDLGGPVFAVDGAITARPGGDADYIRFTPRQGGTVYIQVLVLDSVLGLQINLRNGSCAGPALVPGSDEQVAVQVMAGTAYCVHLRGFQPRAYQFILTPEF